MILIAIVALTGGMFASGHTTPRLGIDLAGGTSITLTAKNEPGQPNAINKTNMDTAVDIIEPRVNGLGVSEAEVQTQGDRNIIVNIPKGTNSEQAREQVGTTAKLYFRPVLAARPRLAAASPSPSPSARERVPPSASADGQRPGGHLARPRRPRHHAGPRRHRRPEGGRHAVAPAAAAEPGAPAARRLRRAAPPPTRADAPGEVRGAGLHRQGGARQSPGRPSRPTRSSPAARSTAGHKYIARPGRRSTARTSRRPGRLRHADRHRLEVNLNFTARAPRIRRRSPAARPEPAAPQNQFAIVLDGLVVSARSVNEALTGGQREITGSFTQDERAGPGQRAELRRAAAGLREAEHHQVTRRSAATSCTPACSPAPSGSPWSCSTCCSTTAASALVALASLAGRRRPDLRDRGAARPDHRLHAEPGRRRRCDRRDRHHRRLVRRVLRTHPGRDARRPTLRAAVERGWRRARRTILAADAVSFLAAAVLYLLAVGNVQGFAFTLGLTTIIDVVVVFLFTKPLMTLLARTKFFGEGHQWSGVDPNASGVKPPLRRTRRRPRPVDDEGGLMSRLGDLGAPALQRRGLLRLRRAAASSGTRISILLAISVLGAGRPRPQPRHRVQGRRRLHRADGHRTGQQAQDAAATVGAGHDEVTRARRRAAAARSRSQTRRCDEADEIQSSSPQDLATGSTPRDRSRAADRSRPGAARSPRRR